MTENRKHGDDKAEELARKALPLFWARGYGETSVDDVVRQTGSNRYALYAACGGKEGLFAAAMDIYVEEITAQAVAVLETPSAGLPEIRAFFDQFVDRLSRPEGRMGCLMCSAASDPAAREPAIVERVETFLARLRDNFNRALRRTKDAGEMGSTADLGVISDFLVGSMIGLMHLARSPAPLDTVINHIRGIQLALDALVVPHQPKHGDYP